MLELAFSQNIFFSPPFEGPTGCCAVPGWHNASLCRMELAAALGLRTGITKSGRLSSEKIFWKTRSRVAVNIGEDLAKLNLQPLSQSHDASIVR